MKKIIQNLIRKSVKVRQEKDSISFFDKSTGSYARTGIIRDGKDTGVDPFMTTFPELLDIGIMGSCIHGKSGLCIAAGVQCYQNGLNAQKSNMSLEDFESIAAQCKDKTFQFALGGCGDPDQHENFEEILKVCRKYDIVPNFTTSGLGMTDDIAKICKEYCGAVAVSWYRSNYTLQAIRMLIENGVKTNIHYVVSNSTIAEAKQRLLNSVGENENGFPKGINAVVFLLHKPVGLGTHEEVISCDNTEFQELLEYIDSTDFPFKIGFDSCTVPALISLESLNVDSVDTCEGARWSAYISADMKMMPCSFDNQAERWAVDLRNSTIQEVWNSNEFEDFRNHFRNSCPECEKRNLCMGGCPICPEIVICNYDRQV